MRKTAALGAWMICLAVVAGPPSAAAGQIDLEVAEQRVTLDAQDADLHELLRQITDASGIRLWISEHLSPQNVSLRSEDLPVPALLERLLQEQSYALVVDDDNGRVIGLFVLPPGEAPPARAELKPGPYRDQASVLRDALASPQIPDNIKLALMAQYNGNQAARAELGQMSRLEMMTRLVDQLEHSGTAKPETILRLRQKLKHMQTEQ